MSHETLYLIASLALSSFALWACYRFAKEEAYFRTLFFFLIASSLFTSAASVVKKSPIDFAQWSQDAKRPTASGG